MLESTASCSRTTSPLVDDLADRLGGHLTRLLALVAQFGRDAPTPTATYDFEKKWPPSSGRRAETSSLMR